MDRFVLPKPETPSVAIYGSDQRFDVRRIFCDRTPVGRWSVVILYLGSNSCNIALAHQSTDTAMPNIQTQFF
ncbi:MAG TPA: hypothetical protein DD729_01410 [Rhodobacteraceae bacterium]|nr:hypothetical protein [Paracoccaceae bacterium]